MPRPLNTTLAVLAAAALAACGGQSGTAGDTSPTTSPTAEAQTTSPAAPGGGDEHASHGDNPEQSPAAAPAPQAPAPGATTIDVTVSGGTVSSPKPIVDVPVGSPVELVVTSDVADHVHVHGYDEMVDVKPGTPARIGFSASIPGVFEVELENTKLRLVQLRVQ